MTARRRGVLGRSWRLLRALTLSFVVLLAVLAAAAAGTVLWLRGSVPPTEERIAAPGLAGPVEVVLDRHAIPHIFAERMEDAHFALGYLHARDRLFQMDMQRRIGAGRLSEWISPSILGEWALDLDRLMRTLGIHRRAAAEFELMSPEGRDSVTAYTNGVNHFLRSRTRPLPPEYALVAALPFWQPAAVEPEPWTPADSLVWQKLMALQLSGNWRQELSRARFTALLGGEQIADLWPDAPPLAPPTLERTARLGEWLPLAALEAVLPEMTRASNAWVVDGARSRTGAPLLASDPHLGLTGPGPWYMARIVTPGRTLVGATSPGVPFHVLGHNGSIAWGFTTTGIDAMDLVVERLDPEDSGRYLTPDGPAAFTTREEELQIRGREPERLVVRETLHGPVLSDVVAEAAITVPGAGTHVMSLLATFLGGDDTTAEALYRLNHADGWDGFEDALRHWVAPQQAVLYADTGGTIGTIVPGRIPIRRGSDGMVPMSGWTGEQGWDGWVPFDEVPAERDPPSGRLVNANHRVVGPDYPHLITHDWDADYRARRIHDVLDRAGPATPDTMMALQTDWVSLMARDLLPLLLQAPPPPAPLARQAHARLSVWDGNMVRDRPEPLIFKAWMLALTEHIAADELGPLAGSFRGLRPTFVRHVLTERPVWCNDVSTPQTEDCPAIIARALEAAVDGLAAGLGEDLPGWRWGELHRADFAHPILGQVPVVSGMLNAALPSDGGSYTVGRGAIRSGGRNPYANVHGAAYRAIYDLSDLDQSLYQLAPGQSGNMLSPHYQDLALAWRDGRYFRLGGTAEQLAGEATARLRFTPAR